MRIMGYQPNNNVFVLSVDDVWTSVHISSALNTSVHFTWWRHQIEIFSALLALCAGNSPVSGEFPAQRPVTRSFDVFFDLRLNKRLSKQSWGWWFETPPCSLWRHCNELNTRHMAKINQYLGPLKSDFHDVPGQLWRGRRQRARAPSRHQSWPVVGRYWHPRFLSVNVFNEFI